MVIGLAAVLVAELAFGVALAAILLRQAETPSAVVVEDSPAPRPAVDPEPRIMASEGKDGLAGARPSPAPAAARWRPSDDEVYPAAKRLAARVVERLTTYEERTQPDLTAASAARRFGVDASDVIATAREVVHPDASSSGTVVYPQLGGVAPEAASVMVVVDQSLTNDDRRWVERRTIDVQLRLDSGQWELDQLGSGGGKAATQPRDLSEEALAVLSHRSIELTDSARWDIYQGGIDDRLLDLMVSIADRHEIAVTTMATGHPEHVFATELISNHTRGRAVDIFKVDGDLVVEQRERGSRAYALTRWVFNQGVPELGSPWSFDGFGGRSFTDIVHADHIHVAV